MHKYKTYVHLTRGDCNDNVACGNCKSLEFSTSCREGGLNCSNPSSVDLLKISYLITTINHNETTDILTSIQQI